MKRFLKILFWTVVTFAGLFVLLMAGFIYKVKNGFPVSFETEAPQIDFPEGKRAVLLFSKSTGFRHGESIEAGKATFDSLARLNDWFMFSTEEGGVFNPEQLSRFNVVIFNNSTGRVLNDEQQSALASWVEGGGNLIGIHGAGDDSHHWDWYVDHLLGATFSHHSLSPQFQETTVSLHDVADSVLVKDIPSSWVQTDEWYVFFTDPSVNGFEVVCSIDGERIDPSGNMMWMKDKGFGMGKVHPVAWYRATGKGRTFYTSMGHGADAWRQAPYVRLLENAVKAD